MIPANLLSDLRRLDRAEKLRVVQFLVNDLAEDDWVNDSPEQIAAEDKAWDAAYARNRDKFRTMADEALEELDTNQKSKHAHAGLICSGAPIRRIPV